MKRILLRTVADDHFPVGSAEYTANLIIYADVIRQVIRRPLDPQKGADIEEMRKGIRVLDAVDRSDQVLELEDADWEHLKAKVQAMPWAMVDKRILGFIDAVTDAGDSLTLNDEMVLNGQVREPVEA